MCAARSARGALLLVLVLGCGHLPPLRTQTEAKVDMAMRAPVEAKVEARMNTLPDHGPLQEVPLSPCGDAPAAAKVALLDVDGLLLNRDSVGPYSAGENPLAAFQEKLTAAANDPAVKAVVLRLNSPGGGVAATEAMWRALVDFRRQTNKPVIACLLDVGTGGAYYLASACDQIIAQPGSVVGGIGVMLNLYYLEIAMEQWNVFSAGIKAGDHIDMGSPARKMTAEEKGMLVAMAREYHDHFKQAVMQGRPRLKGDATFFDGRVMTATKALEVGLVDRVGELPDAIEHARQLAGCSTAAVVFYRRAGSSARSLYDTVPNRPAQGLSLPSLPGLERSNLPLFLYLWQVEPTVVRLAGPY